MKISLLLPSRGRPDQFKRMWQSALDMADDKDNIEIVVRVDEDDPTHKEYSVPNGMIGIGERRLLSEYWNECQQIATGEIYMHCGDDLIFRNKGWDTKVREAFNKYPDRILFVHGDDGYWGASFGTHGFIHKNWVETVGYFVPPYFSSDYNDTWLNDVANHISRRLYIPEIVTEHMHWTFNKGPLDQTHLDRIKRHNEDNVEQLYASKAAEREQDARKLQEFINSYVRL